LGLVVYRQGENALAEALLSEAAAIQRVQRDHRGLALSLGYLGEIQRCHGNYRRAKSLYEESLTFAEELDIKPYRAVLLCNLAQVSLRLGDLAKAIKLCECSLDLTEKAGYQPQFPLCLSALAGIAIQSDQPRRAILLLAAAQAQLKALGIALEPADQAEYDRTLAAVRAGLDQDVFVTAWAQGLAMTQEQSLAYAWQHLPLPENGRAELSLPVPVRLAGLTDREVEVLALAAQGLSNRQIAERLVLSQRTVETYMSSIYTKLKTTSRTDAICFAIEHRL
jgi:DNA-binding NarL/FixJ family response regulator